MDKHIKIEDQIQHLKTNKNIEINLRTNEYEKFFKLESYFHIIQQSRIAFVDKEKTSSTKFITYKNSQLSEWIEFFELNRKLSCEVHAGIVEFERHFSTLVSDVLFNNILANDELMDFYIIILCTDYYFINKYGKDNNLPRNYRIQEVDKGDILAYIKCSNQIIIFYRHLSFNKKIKIFNEFTLAQKIDIAYNLEKSFTKNLFARNNFDFKQSFSLEEVNTAISKNKLQQNLLSKNIRNRKNQKIYLKLDEASISFLNSHTYDNIDVFSSKLYQVCVLRDFVKCLTIISQIRNDLSHNKLITYSMISPSNIEIRKQILSSFIYDSGEKKKINKLIDDGSKYFHYKKSSYSK